MLTLISDQTIAGLVVLVLHKIIPEQKNVITNIESHYIIIMGSCLLDNTIILNI